MLAVNSFLGTVPLSLLLLVGATISSSPLDRGGYAKSFGSGDGYGEFWDCGIGSGVISSRLIDTGPPFGVLTGLVLRLVAMFNGISPGFLRETGSIFLRNLRFRNVILQLPSIIT